MKNWKNTQNTNLLALHSERYSAILRLLNHWLPEWYVVEVIIIVIIIVIILIIIIRDIPLY